MIRVLLLIMFDELHFYVWNVWAKYMFVNGNCTLVLFGKQRLELGSLLFSTIGGHYRSRKAKIIREHLFN